METSELPTFYRPLMDALDDLSEYTFQRFKVYLEDRDLLKDFGTIPRSKVEAEDRTKILKAMLDAYGIFTVTVTKRLLQHLYMNKLLDELSQWHYDPLDIVAACQDKLKNRFRTKFHVLIERITECGDERPFNERYTELYVSLEENVQASSEHEFRQVEREARRDSTETTLQCQDIFRGHTRRGQPIRFVLTKGVAGIGKTVLTQKFSLDWAEGKANQDIQLLFPFTFRELNVLRDSEYTLLGLLHHCFSETEELWSVQHLQMGFIFDGLDECRLPLDFSRTQVLTKATESASVEVLLVNLIRGNLLPSARLWVTTRPAAANQIPTGCVSLATEVRGFTDPQKEQYFRKRFRHEQATAVISHIKKSRSLLFMCRMPVFCWILSTVIENIMKVKELQELPQTLTNLYIHFLVVQLKQKNVKFDGELEAASAWSPENKEMVQSLCKLAFEQLKKRNLIFYKRDLNECGLDAAAAARYSGVLTEVFREESGLYRDLVYCFVHLSVQEFLAALHVHQTFFESGVNLLSTHPTSESPESVESFYQTAIDCASRSPNGHLDLFLRFLLGLSLRNNQSLLQELLSHTGSGSSTDPEPAKYIKKKMKSLSAEKNINMFHCLNELNDKTLIDYLQRGMSARSLSKQPMLFTHWSGVAFLLLASDTDLEQFDLRKYQSTEQALLGLLPVVREAKTANLSWGHLSPHSCAPLASVLSSSGLSSLDLSNNDLMDSGVELLCSGLKSAPCRLETLRLSGCLVTERGGASLASALSSSSSRLRELDLSYNHLGPTAALLTALQDQPHRPLNCLRLDPTGERWLTPGIRKYFHDLSLDMSTINTSLRLSDKGRCVTYVCDYCVKVQHYSDQCYPEHQDRFSHCPQVLCSPALTGRCYWEVEWNGAFMLDIAVSYRGIRRKGSADKCRFGQSDRSWCLRINRSIPLELKGSDKPFLILHNKTEARLSSALQSFRVGVFLDSEAGVLSFFQVLSKGQLSHLHTIHTAFTEPLFAGLGVDWCGCSLSLKRNVDAQEDTYL